MSREAAIEGLCPAAWPRASQARDNATPPRGAPTAAAREHEKMILRERMLALEREISRGRAAACDASAKPLPQPLPLPPPPLPPPPPPQPPPPQDGPSVGLKRNRDGWDDDSATWDGRDSQDEHWEEAEDEWGGEEEGEGWDNVSAADRASSAGLDALAGSLSSAPCPKGGVAVAGVRVQETRQRRGGVSTWQCRVLCQVRCKRKSKEKLAEERCLARSEHRDRGEARGAAEAEAVAVLRGIAAGTVSLRAVSEKRRGKEERSRREDTRTDKSGQPGFVVLEICAGVRGKKRQKGQPRKPQLWVRGPHGNEAAYPTRTLRGLHVQPGDRLRWHNLQNPRYSHFTHDHGFG
jgi:hypothetical protein